MSPHPFAVGLLGLLALGLASGCGSSQMSRIDRNRELYETWPIEVRQAVLDGKVEPGMTPDMVQVAWGRPTEIVSQGAPGDEIWVYEIGGSDGSVIIPGPGGGVYPAGSVGYPSGMGYPGGRGGITIGTGTMGTGIGVGGGYPNYPGGYPGGVGAPIVIPPTRPEIREVVFRNGVVHRADNPQPK